MFRVDVRDKLEIWVEYDTHISAVGVGEMLLPMISMKRHDLNSMALITNE